MLTTKTPRPRFPADPLRRWSIQKKLPFLIFLLLLTMIIAFSWLSYAGIRKTALEAGRVRLYSLSEQLSSMFAQSAQGLVAVTRTGANQPAVKAFLQSKGEDSAQQTHVLLEKLRSDSTWVLVELLNRERQIVLQSGEQWQPAGETLNQLDAASRKPMDTGSVGKIFPKDGKLYYPVEVAIMDQKKIMGYLIRWRRLQTTQQAIDRFTRLLGDHVTLYIGNMDGTVWTDLKEQVQLPAVAVDTSHSLKEYDLNGQFYSLTTPIRQTGWQLLVAIPKKELAQPANRFLRIALSSGLILLAAGIFLTWLLSRSITKPLEKLTLASSSMAGGNYEQQVKVSSHNELGQLAKSFNLMAEEVQAANSRLETKVKERTAQLEAANKELEAFSYSVSHDLRAPLRAVSGYAGMLKEDYGQTLDAEGNRLIDQVVRHTAMMGQLIDDLIAFARTSRKETSYQQVDMKTMARDCYEALLQHQPQSHVRFELMDLPPCTTDRDLMRQVWLNLISNALKYSSREPSPLVQIGYLLKDGQTVYYVRDNGVGFDMKYADKLFGVFQRLHRPEEFEGTGVGLALAGRIIHKQGGKIWAKAAPNEGACFYFSIPETPISN